jgi:hypothetical protein
VNRLELCLDISSFSHPQIVFVLMAIAMVCAAPEPKADPKAKADPGLLAYSAPLVASSYVPYAYSAYPYVSAPYVSAPYVASPYAAAYAYYR